MYKKILRVLPLLLMAGALHAQKANIQSAINYMKDNDIANAKKMIDEACKNESTKNNAKAWLLKGVIYQAIATPKEVMPQMSFILNENPYIINLENANALASSAPDALNEAVEAYKKHMTLDPKYSKEELLPLLGTLLGLEFNNGISKMNDNKFADAFTAFEGVGSLSRLDNGNLWKGMPNLDTAFANAKMYQANCAFNTGKDDDAISLLEECIKNPISQRPDLYIMLTDLYSKKGNEAKWAEAMKAARSKYPNDKRILNNEINYYIEKGKAEESINKLKEGIALDPAKVDLYLLLGQTYLAMANPSDKNDKPLTRPANAAELETNAITNYAKAAELDGKNPYAQFNLGLIYYNQAKFMTDEMNKADNKKYEEMKPKRDELITKALPYLGKAREIMEGDKGNEAYKSMYRETMTGLMNCYNVQNKTEQAAEIKKILDIKK